MIWYQQGRPVRLEQVANVVDSVETVTQAAWLYTKDGRQRAITLQVQKQPGTNVIEVTDRVRALLPSLEAQLPPSVHLKIRQDRSKTIREAFGDIQVTMGITLCLVIAVIFLFLHNGSATLIPALALPFSILGTFAVMRLLNYSLDNLSMMALILSIGFVVDDAIVMLENIVRHIEAGAAPLAAALTGSKEIAFTILTMTTSLAAVFIPILFMGGILGRLFREFAVTITTAILISGLVSVTLTPMLCSRFLRVVHSKVGFAGLDGSGIRRAAALVQRSLRLGVETPDGRCSWSLARCSGQRSRCTASSGKGSFQIPTTTHCSSTSRAAQGTSFYEMVDTTQRVADERSTRTRSWTRSWRTQAGGAAGRDEPGTALPPADATEHATDDGTG